MIEVNELSKRYRDTLAVDRLSFVVKSGLVTGFLGPNGAGKSTTMRTILGLDVPTSGAALVDGRRYATIRRPLHQVGALLDANAVHGGRTAFQHLYCLARANRIGKSRVETVLGLVGLSSVGGKRINGFSLGMKQRLGDRPAPINPWPHGLASAAMPAFASGLLVTVVCLVALGLGTVIRSTAGMLVSMITLLLILPSVAAFLPSPWDIRVAAVLPLNLATALANSTSTISSPLSPLGAALLMIGYVAISLGAAAFVINKRDA